jgi:hypothetical protein
MGCFLCSPRARLCNYAIELMQLKWLFLMLIRDARQTIEKT